MPTTDNDTAAGVNITPLVINSLRAGIHTYARTWTSQTKAILRNQAHAWFKKVVDEN